MPATRGKLAGGLEGVTNTATALQGQLGKYHLKFYHHNRVNYRRKARNGMVVAVYLPYYFSKRFDGLCRIENHDW